MILRPYKMIRELQKEIKQLNKQIEELKSKNENNLCEKHKTGFWCNGCKNLVKEKCWNMVQGTYEAKFCQLENPCEDRIDE